MNSFMQDGIEIKTCLECKQCVKDALQGMHICFITKECARFSWRYVNLPDSCPNLKGMPK